jgi:hypothetical protein
MNAIKDLVSLYPVWLRDNTQLREMKDWVEITTPFLDRNNDAIQLYARRSNGGYILTDDGYTLVDLEASGCSLDSDKRQSILRMTLNGFGVKLEGNALTVHAERNDFPLRKHNLIQAVLAVNDLFHLASPRVRSLFLEDVTSWLDLLEVRYVPTIKISGASAFDHVFDFAIPRSRSAPERLLRAISDPNRERAESFMFAWNDTHEARKGKPTAAYAILNDNERSISSGIADALQAYGIKPVAWSRRDHVRGELVA